MAGHSKWNNIKQRKGAQDAKRSGVFQKLSKEIYKAAKDGGADVEMNASLRMAVDKAKASNMPNDNIDRAIKRATDSGQGANYDEVVYEGYGPNGIAILVHTLTDNLNRTNTNIYIAFDRNSGSLGEKGSVSYMFDRKGYIAIDREGLDVDEDTMLMHVLEAGGEELETSDEVFEIYTEATDFTAVRDAMKEAGFDLDQAELMMVPQTMLPLPEDKTGIFEQLIDALEDDDDVSEVYHNAEL
ncbi:YebC/PmpR family DNA-binding transcriptional regulator [Alkalibacterium sp. 20]|uniref:YebC/PmpR family DNA-binding transcriptional regulator n=1 Tax=Alkalibacterium sp. 20 TaxID=1798803 RepID=UPI00090040F2|nr:YebC/PmpR family DNA-binding transcriptional regulator [Alkalibacterium sp. 20]OJF94298.1 transcriptional regulator [Alkalibacterium sp. 20]